jgi:tRNA (Thr-GGU) A37 N-methylase
MKKIIRGLYIAFFPEEHEKNIRMYIRKIEDDLRRTEDLLVASVDQGKDTPWVDIRNTVNDIKSKRSSEKNFSDILFKGL